MPSMVRLAPLSSLSRAMLIPKLGLTGKKEGKTRLMNMVMQVRLAPSSLPFPTLTLPLALRSSAKSLATLTSSTEPSRAHPIRPMSILSRTQER